MCCGVYRAISASEIKCSDKKKSCIKWKYSRKPQQNENKVSTFVLVYNIFKTFADLTIYAASALWRLINSLCRFIDKLLSVGKTMQLENTVVKTPFL